MRVPRAFVSRNELRVIERNLGDSADRNAERRALDEIPEGIARVVTGYDGVRCCERRQSILERLVRLSKRELELLFRNLVRRLLAGALDSHLIVTGGRELTGNRTLPWNGLRPVID